MILAGSRAIPLSLAMVSAPLLAVVEGLAPV